ncbi:sugar porter family MFS transporter [Clostridium saccharobutylicum]|uniref:D-xylose-proton symporter XylT n=1 Tax=Clostridium saccharobutylicum DSM 13864 TaxID=1345695 RepID=U5MKS0_CLOSA|nr:sugar porter family MFS transporter [Clostridium saccharobutylicum]AGX41210.1 D-xylose-proton symporter XylT [Clostridium saccharobutylicum DSM 13864]AQR88496.1 putative metabolite transport protein CsbC [Clostridium saccharobutylicum]AQR98394.1 putative metabolite transport protein CsbC [Clostridium saccharobutylicum]AQS08105.1 putative metabolite transport protein CsbC [Clostridium saccharobutylicum]AQS12384.1 putative metabolite transport protein CsbC [Clostridium saccharobutylicum]
MNIKVRNSLIYVFGALSGLLFGYDTGVISGAILFIEKQMNLNSWQQGWIVSSVLLGAVLGAAIIGPMSDKYGRKKLILLSSLIFFVGALGSAFSPEFWTLMLSRIVLGIAVGASSALIPTYLAELSPAEKRGSMSSLFQLMVMSGILLAYITNYSFSGLYSGWRIMLGFAAIPAAILFLGALILPESPRFLVKDGRLDEAKEVLIQMNKNNQSIVKKELIQIKKQAEIKSGGIKELFGNFVRPALIIGFGLAVFQQVMGCNTVLYYAPTIFTNVGFGVQAALLAHIGIGIFNVIITAIAVAIMDKIDRKKMLIYGAIGMGVSLIIMSVSMKFSNGSFTASIICVIALTIYIAFFSATWGPVMWVMIGEVFPLNIRGLGNSFSSVINWASNMVVSLTFPTLLDYFGTGSLFIGYGIICFVAIWFVKSKVFETRNRSLEEIEATLRARSGENDKQNLCI